MVFALCATAYLIVHIPLQTRLLNVVHEKELAEKEMYDKDCEIARLRKVRYIKCVTCAWLCICVMHTMGVCSSWSRLTKNKAN